MVALVEPEITQFRARFDTPYAFGRDRYQRQKKCRLMELNTTTALPGDDDYFGPVRAGEFVVVDVVTREKAWFEWMDGLEPQHVTELIAGHFGDAAYRVGERVWFV